MRIIYKKKDAKCQEFHQKMQKLFLKTKKFWEKSTNKQNLHTNITKTFKICKKLHEFQETKQKMHKITSKNQKNLNKKTQQMKKIYKQKLQKF